MVALNVRVDAETANFLARLARQTGRTKSEVVRAALAALHENELREAGRPPIDRVRHVIGSCDSASAELSERTGERFAAMLKDRLSKAVEGRSVQRPNRRRAADRPD